MFFRKRMYPTAIQATFPGVNGVNTIVIGQAELTADKTSTRWVLTVLHEHFHQLVYSQPGYYADVEKLGLAHGDKTGMWMLNYPFPYDSARVQEKFTAMTHALLDALAQTDQPALEKKVAAKGYVPSAEFSALPYFAGYGSVASAARAKILSDLGSLSLAKSRREVVYSVGAAEALLLDRTKPEWKRDFLTHRFRLPDPR